MKAEAQRIEIAKTCGYKMGEKTEPSFSDPGKYVHSPSWIHPRSYAVRTLPDYLEDLNAAVDFATHLTTMGWRCQMNNGLDTTWECEFFRPIQPSTHEGNIGEMDGEKMEIHYGCGDTLAVAICQAGLRALEKFVEE